MSSEFEKKKTFIIKTLTYFYTILHKVEGYQRSDCFLCSVNLKMQQLTSANCLSFVSTGCPIKSLLEICQLQAVHAVKSAQAKQGNPTPTSMSRLCPRYNWDIVFMESKPCRNNFNECCTSGPPEHYYLVAALSKQFQVLFFFFPSKQLHERNFEQLLSPLSCYCVYLF